MKDTSEHTRRRWGTNKTYFLILLAIFALSLILRIVFRQDAVFGSDWVRFAETDPWYHIRLIENLLHHFPQNITFDPYTFFPFGRNVYFAPLFDLLLGSVIWVIGAGSPSQHTLEVVAAYFPAVMGALVTVPVFFIGKELFGRKTGLICAALIAVLPGNFLARSLLGVTDHHVAEVFFSVLAVLFLMLALKEAVKKQLDFGHVRPGNWRLLRKTLVYSLLFGLFLGTYMLSWVGGLLVLLILYVYFVIQFIVDHLAGKSTDYLCMIGVPAFIIALIMVTPFIGQGSLDKMHPISLAAGIVTFTALAFLSKWLVIRKIRRIYYLPLLVVIGIAAALIIYFLARPVFASVTRYVDLFLPGGFALTITEAQPLFRGFDFGNFTGSRPWGFFTTGFFFVPVSLGLLIYYSVKKTRADITLFLTWTILMLLAMVGQNRFSYYFAVNTAICGGYISWKIYELIRHVFKRAGLEKTKPEAAPVSVTAKRGKKSQKAQRKEVSPGKAYPGIASAGLAVIICFFLVFFPNFSQIKSVAGSVPAPDNDWHAALTWMKDNTPEPFSSADYYYALYEKPRPGHSYVYPESSYGVMSWWDYGHWITAIAHRIPNANAFQDGAWSAGRYFTATDELSANKYLDQLRSKYVILDKSMVSTKFNAMSNWGGSKQASEYYYQRNSDGKMEAVQVFYPEYYRSMCCRLYNFEGKAVVPGNSTRVISFAEKTDINGKKYKEIITSKLYATYAEAVEICNQSPDHIIVGTEPFISPVPLEELEHYRLIYQSPTIVGKDGDRMLSNVEIFEYLP